MLTTSEVRGYVAQGIRARFGKAVDGVAAFDAWLERRDGVVVDVADSFRRHAQEDPTGGEPR